MKGRKYIPLPDECCIKCRYCKPVSSGKLICRHDDSLYFEAEVTRREHCPEFVREKKK